MGAFIISIRDGWVDGLGITLLSLHTDDPAQTGANEVSGGSPAYAKKSVSFGAASDGVANSAAGVTFDVPAGTIVTHVGYWAGGTFKGSDAIPNEVYALQGTHIINNVILAVTD